MGFAAWVSGRFVGVDGIGVVVRVRDPASAVSGCEAATATTSAVEEREEECDEYGDDDDDY